jgi:hypothetical protein
LLPGGSFPDGAPAKEVGIETSPVIIAEGDEDAAADGIDFFFILDEEGRREEWGFTLKKRSDGRASQGLGEKKDEGDEAAEDESHWDGRIEIKDSSASFGRWSIADWLRLCQGPA